MGKKLSFIDRKLSRKEEIQANRRAIERLVKKHPDEYLSILKEERTKL